MIALTVLIGSLVMAGGEESAPPSKPAAQAASPDRSGDLQAIAAIVDALVKGFNAGDAKAVSALFTPDAVIIDEDGNATQGRAEIEATFAGGFEQDPGATLAIQVGTIRFVGSDTAIEEGTSLLTPGKEAAALGATSSTSRYTAVYSKQADGTWLQASVNEVALPRPINPAEQLAPLDWLVGDWVDESPAAIISTHCEWAPGKTAITRTFTAKVRGGTGQSGSQRIAWDPIRKQVRSWMFDTDGGFSEGFWVRDGERWIIHSTGFTAEGVSIASTQILSPESKDRMRWESIDRSVDGERIPDFAPVLLVRQPPQPK